jgi:hypothetical protein
MNIEQFENTIARLQLEAINYSDDPNFNKIQELVELLGKQISVYKKVRLPNFNIKPVEIGYLNIRNELIIYSPIRESTNNDCDYPLLGLPGFVNVSGDRVFPINLHNEVTSESGFSLGILKNNQLILWSQYFK